MSGAVHTPLVERLRATQVPGMLSGCCDLESLVNPDGPEAADTINELLEALEGLLSYVERYCSESSPSDAPVADAASAIARAKGEAQ